MCQGKCKFFKKNLNLHCTLFLGIIHKNRNAPYYGWFEVIIQFIRENEILPGKCKFLVCVNAELRPLGLMLQSCMAGLIL